MDLNIYQNQLSEKQLTYTNSLISYKLELLNLKIQTLYDFEKKGSSYSGNEYSNFNKRIELPKSSDIK